MDGEKQRKQKRAKRPLNNNQTPAQAIETKKKYDRFLHQVLKTGAYLANTHLAFKPRQGLSVLCNIALHSKARMNSTGSYTFETLAVAKPHEHVIHVELNRPEKRNAMNWAFWREMVECFKQIADDSNCRAVVLTGAGKIFTAGLDLREMGGDLMNSGTDPSRRAFYLRKFILSLQKSFHVIEECPQPVIAAVHSGCLGGGIDMICSCDMRLCSADAWFQVKEIDLGLAADLGTLQKFPKIIGNDGLARELCYTGRSFTAQEALDLGFVSRICSDRESLVKEAVALATEISKKSPVAVAGIKHNLNYSREHSPKDGMEYMATWNMAMLQSEDILKAVQAGMTNEEATFSKL